jgi:hypothetical protein
VCVCACVCDNSARGFYTSEQKLWFSHNIKLCEILINYPMNFDVNYQNQLSRSQGSISSTFCFFIYNESASRYRIQILNNLFMSSFYTHRFQKRKKILMAPLIFSACVKAVRKTLMKLTPGWVKIRSGS